MEHPVPADAAALLVAWGGLMGNTGIPGADIACTLTVTDASGASIFSVAHETMQVADPSIDHIRVDNIPITTAGKITFREDYGICFNAYVLYKLPAPPPALPSTPPPPANRIVINAGGSITVHQGNKIIVEGMVESIGPSA